MTSDPARDLFEHAANAAYYATHPHPRGYSPWEEKQARRATSEVMAAISEYLMRDYARKTAPDQQDMVRSLVSENPPSQLEIAKLLGDAAKFEAPNQK